MFKLLKKIFGTKKESNTLEQRYHEKLKADRLKLAGAHAAWIEEHHRNIMDDRIKSAVRNARMVQFANQDQKANPALVLGEVWNPWEPGFHSPVRSGRGKHHLANVSGGTFRGYPENRPVNPDMPFDYLTSFVYTEEPNDGARNYPRIHPDLPGLGEGGSTTQEADLQGRVSVCESAVSTASSIAGTAGAVRSVLRTPGRCPSCGQVFQIIPLQ